ncbi:MAG: zinc-ribbon domain-containing protein [Lachnospiraceae bacterium]|nr:zinc-ribbon domain-containing protein [Lachnospiraceae bacterium]
MLCVNCGNEIADEAKFCQYCGHTTGNSTIQESTTTVKNEEVRESNKVRMTKREYLFKTGRLVIGIVSIVLFLVIMFQSCAVGVVNTFEDNGSASGTAGAILAVCWLVAGIVGIAGRRNKYAIGTSVGFYCFGGLIGIANIGIYSDLAIWSMLSFAFALIYLLSVLLYRKKFFHKMSVGVFIELALIIIALVIAFCIPDSEENGEVKKEEKRIEKEVNNKGKESKRDEYSLTVSELLEEYESNQIVAKEKYEDNIVKLEGQISFIGGEDDYYVSLADPHDEFQISSINCYVDYDIMKDLKTGDIVIAKGIARDSFWGMELYDCTVKVQSSSDFDMISANTPKEVTSEFVGEMGRYVSWDNGYETYLTFDTDDNLIYYMSFETAKVPNFIDGWVLYQKGDGKTLVVDTYYGNGEQGQIEFIWETPTSLVVRVIGGTGFSDDELDYDMDRLLNGKRFTLADDTISMYEDSNSFLGVDGCYTNGSDIGYGCVEVWLNQPYAYIEMSIDGGEYIYQMEAEYVDTSMLTTQWENGTNLYFYWENAGTLLVGADNSTGAEELDWLIESQRYWNSEYLQTS